MCVMVLAGHLRTIHKCGQFVGVQVCAAAAAVKISAAPFSLLPGECGSLSVCVSVPA